MSNEVRGCVPKMPFLYARTLVNRAWKDVRESHLWSFNIFDGAWISPPLVSAGLATATLGLNTVTLDATAAAAINAASATYSLITQRQFRCGIGGIYNIIGWDGATTLTLDRIFADPSQTLGGYNIYQCYYTAPMQDFLTWVSVRNMQLFLNLNLDKQRQWVDAQDPQRSWYQFPSHVIPFGIDLRAGSATLGYPIFELWGQAITPYTYQFYGLRRGTDLANPGDTLPIAIGEDLVLARAKYYAYEWAEANKDIAPRSQGPDFKFLMGATETVYKKLLTQYRRQDKELLDMHNIVRDPAFAGIFGSFYNTFSGFAGSR
jgi:hypothetical protein